MRAELKSVMSSDIDPSTYFPEKEDSFGVFIQATIGPEGVDSGDVFGFQVCSPKWLASQIEGSGIMWGRHLIILVEYDFSNITQEISSLCARTFGSNWQEVAAKIARYGQWEFEDYQV